jgi:DNA polymerase III epsilon subunit-like protein
MLMISQIIRRKLSKRKKANRIKRLKNQTKASNSEEQSIEGKIEVTRKEILDLKPSISFASGFHVSPGPVPSKRHVSETRVTPLKEWYRTYNTNNVFALDCEFVRKDKVHHLATVSIVGFRGNIVYEGKVYHKPGSFVVDQWTLAINGFKTKDFLDGRHFSEIQRDVMKIIKGEDKLIITCGHQNDFRALSLETSEYNIFDLQDIYWCRNYNKNGIVIPERVGLARLYYKFFGTNPHLGIHSASTDAKYTMKIFREKYIKSDLRFDRQNKEGFDLIDFPALPKHLLPLHRRRIKFSKSKETNDMINRFIFG